MPLSKKDTHYTRKVDGFNPPSSAVADFGGHVCAKLALSVTKGVKFLIATYDYTKHETSNP